MFVAYGQASIVFCGYGHLLNLPTYLWLGTLLYIDPKGYIELAFFCGLLLMWDDNEKREK